MNKRIIAAFGTVILGAAVIAGIGTYVASAKNDSRVMQATSAGTMETPEGTLPHYTLEISSYPDSMAGRHGADGGAHPGYVSYGPVTNFEVPAHVALTITVKKGWKPGLFCNQPKLWVFTERGLDAKRPFHDGAET